MKTMMKKVARALTLLTALLGAGQAMGNTYTLNTGPIEKSIIRALDTDTNAAIIYIKKTTGVSAFIYVDKLMYTKTFTVYKNIEVNDMEVLDGKLFFCGKSDTTGIVGFFDIHDLFEGSGTIKIGNQLHKSDVSELHMVTNLRRMDAYKQRRTYMIVAVGDEQVSASNYHYDRTCAISARYADDSWSCSMLYDKPGDWIFQDVVCTDDLVVLTANANDGTGCYVKAFNKHSAACFLQPIDSSAIYQIASTSTQKVPWNDILGYSAGGNAMKLAFAKQIALLPCRRENTKTTKIYYNYDGMTIDVVKETCGGSVESMKAVLDCEE